MKPTEAFSEALSRFQAGDAAAALWLCNDLIAAIPSDPAIWQLAGLAAFSLRRFAAATHYFGHARALQPGDPAHAINLANALIKLDRDAEAAAALQAALALDPHSSDAEIALGIIARRAGSLEEAVLHADRAIASRPDAYPAWVNRGRALHELGRFDTAIKSYQRAVTIDPDAAPAHAQMALSLLLTGDFERGWREYAWRGEGSDLVSLSRFDQPEWQGGPLSGATLLVHAEQGFGDTIQFARFLPLAEARGGRVILEVQPALKRLFAGFSSSIAILARGEPLPSFQQHIRLLSLPRVLGIGLDTIPPPLRFRLPSATGAAIVPRIDRRLTVGLSWAGRSTHENDRNRSIAPELLAPLADVAGIRWVSVQKDRPGPKPDFIELDLGPRLDDLTDLARAMPELDLLITIDSAPAHLMGSLRLPVWVLLPDPPDWRWLLGREDSPWYPTVRLFRQRERGNWPEVIERVGAALKMFRDEKAGFPLPCLD